MSRKKWSSDKIFNRLINNKSQNTFWDNIHELRRRPNAEVYEMAYKLANSKNEKEIRIGVYVLAQFGTDPRINQKETVDLFFKLLNKHQSPKIIEAVLASISHNNEILTEEQIKHLVTFESHTYSDVRFSLTLALSCLENNTAIKTLINLSKDKYASIRNWATFGLGSQIIMNNELIINSLWDRINDKDKETRFEAIAGLSKRKDSRIKAILIEELDKIDNHGSIILESIEDLNDKEFISLLETKILVNKQEGSINEEWLVECLKKLKQSTT